MSGYKLHFFNCLLNDDDDESLSFTKTKVSDFKTKEPV